MANTDTNIQKIFEYTDLVAICESSINVPLNSIFNTKKQMLDNWLDECFTTQEQSDGSVVYIPIVLKILSTNDAGDTIELNVPKYLSYGKIGTPTLDKMEVKIEWSVSSQFSRGDIEQKAITNINITKVDASSGNSAAKVNVNLSLIGNTTATSADETFKSLSQFIAAQNKTTLYTPPATTTIAS